MKVYFIDLSNELEELILYGQIKNERKKVIRKEEWKLRVNSFIIHISRDKSCLKPPLVKIIDIFFDGNNLYELKIKLSNNLVRIFFVCCEDSIIMFNLLIKPFLYEKQKKREVEKEYNIKIREAKNLYSDLVNEKIELKEYIKLI